MRRRVLVVQPREALALVTVRSLAGGDFETELVAHGDRAISRARSEARFDAVLVDCTAPVLDGWYVLAALGGDADRPYLLAYAQPGDAERARRLGADRCAHDRDDLPRQLSALLAREASVRP